MSETRPPERQVIERYGPGGFRISGKVFTGPVLVFPDAALDWLTPGIETLEPASFQPVVDHGGVEILLLGTGRRMQPVPPLVRRALREVGIVVDAMDSGAACRTFGVLQAEERRVAAALLPLRD